MHSMNAAKIIYSMFSLDTLQNMESYPTIALNLIHFIPFGKLTLAIVFAAELRKFQFSNCRDRTEIWFAVVRRMDGNWAGVVGNVGTFTWSALDLLSTTNTTKSGFCVGFWRYYPKVQALRRIPGVRMSAWVCHCARIPRRILAFGLRFEGRRRTLCGFPETVIRWVRFWS